MSQKCVHKGCGKLFDDPDEPCTYHPGPPIFHEGQKGWKCCKPRVLTFDEFMAITPCTTAKHSTVDDTPAPEAPPSASEVEAKIKAQQQQQRTPAVSRAPIAAQPPPQTAPTPAPPEDEDDDPDVAVPAGATCKRRGCGSTYPAGAPREGEQCVHHPGQALFHEGSKGWTCCKKRVLEFDEFMKLPGCHTREKHLFVGPKKKDAGAEERLETVRSDFYQTATSVIASLYLKKIDEERSTVTFTDANTVALDLHTTDGKGYSTTLSTFGAVKPEACAFKIMGTKLELTLAKADGSGWPVLRKEDRHTGEIIQAGRAGRV
ncbi:hypothetical protein LTR08_006900 [Meristemomyces frigidus]|nr:hypothetical protein LTR08_006900 [Meristemomyces frigidus]